MPLPALDQFDLLQQIPLGICIVSREYIILSWNKLLQSWTQTTAEQMQGTNLLEAFPHLASAGYRSRFEMAFEGGAPSVFSPQLHPHFFPSFLPNGTQRILRTVAVPQVKDAGQSILIICSQDVTSIMDQLQTIQALQRKTAQEAEERQKVLRELEEANEHLLAYNKEKDRVMRILSHDLRSPLSSILSASEIIQRSADKADVVNEFSRLITSVSTTLIDLINNFLEMARASDGKIVLTPDDCDLRNLVQRSVDVVRVLASDKGIEVSVSFPPDLPLLMLDRMKMFQVLTNLLSNAVKFTPQGGAITLNIERDAHGDVLLHVADTGIGIPAEHLPKVFDQFGVYQRTGTSGERGTGLGLALVKSLVEMHGGTISVRSTAGVGTTFTLLLPVHSPLRLPPSELSPEVVAMLAETERLLNDSEGE